MDARIDRLQRFCAASPGVLALGGGLPSASLFPRRELAQAFMAAVAEGGCPALQYGWPEGDLELRAWIAARLGARGADVTADDVVITNGAQQALAIAAETLLRRGSRVGVDKATYPCALDLFRARGATVALHEDDVDVSYVMPGVVNPGGHGMTTRQREALVAAGIPLIVDEAYAELRFDGVVPRPLVADARDRAWHVGSFSKTLCPGLRVGWLVPPRADLDAVIQSKHDRDLQAGSLSQAVVRSFLRQDDFDARLARARAYYEARAERLVHAIRLRFPTFSVREPEGGFSVFVETDLEGDDAALLESAARHGLAFDPGTLFQVARASDTISLRLCYSSVEAVDDLDEAASRLERAVLDFTRRPAPSRADRRASQGAVACS